MRTSHAFRGLLAALPLLATLNACAPRLYAPNPQNVPLHSERGEGGFSVSATPNLNRVDARGALAVGRHVGIQGGGSLYLDGIRRPQDNSDDDGAEGAYFEAGVGYFHALPFDFQPLPFNLVLETYALAGYGVVENHLYSAAEDEPGTTGLFDADLYRLSLQPAVGFKTRWAEAALSSRFSWTHYFAIDGDLVVDGESRQEYMRDNPIQFFIEPAVTVRGGPKFLQLEFQTGLSFATTDADFPRDKGWISLGIVSHFSPTKGQ